MTFKAWIRTITFYDIFVGMHATMSHMVHYRPVTEQYPHEKRTLPDNYRGMLALLRYDDGTEKCVGCDLCEAACPRGSFAWSARRCRASQRSAMRKSIPWT